jgi:hypothetical protein
VVDDQRATGRGEEFTEMDGMDGIVAGVEIGGAFLEEIVLDGSALREFAAKCGDALGLLHEVHFGEAKLLALGEIFGGLIGETGLAVSAVDGFVDHEVRSLRDIGLRWDEGIV